MMTPKEALIHQQLVKTAERGWPALLDNPAVGYGLAGAGLGAGISTLRTLMRPRHERRGGLGRAASAGVLGGLTGGAAGAGLQLMGKSPPTIRELPGILSAESTTSKPEGIGRSAAIGLAGAGGLGGLSVLESGRLMAQERASGMRSPSDLMSAWGATATKAPPRKGSDAASIAAKKTKGLTNRYLGLIGRVGQREGATTAKRRAADIIKTLTNNPGHDQAVVSNIRRALDQVGRTRGLERIGASRFARLATNPRALVGAAAGIGVGNFAFRNLFRRQTDTK